MIVTFLSWIQPKPGQRWTCSSSAAASLTCHPRYYIKISEYTNLLISRWSKILFNIWILTGPVGRRNAPLEILREGFIKKKKWEFSHSGEGPPPPKSGKKYYFFILYIGSKKCFYAKKFFFGNFLTLPLNVGIHFPLLSHYLFWCLPFSLWSCYLFLCCYFFVKYHATVYIKYYKYDWRQEFKFKGRLHLKKIGKEKKQPGGGGVNRYKKNFFAFLDDSGHVLKLVFESGKKCRKGRPPPKWENSHFLAAKTQLNKS